jgi:hypothetical protein
MVSRVGALVSVVVLVWAASSLNMAEANGLSAQFYAKSCPEYEKIIYNYVTKLYNSPLNNTVVSMIRWAFHDFVNVSRRLNLPLHPIPDPLLSSTLLWTCSISHLVCLFIMIY